MTGKEKWGEDFNSETNGMSLEWAIGTAAGLDMSRIEHRTIRGLRLEMLPAARTAVAELAKQGDAITEYIGDTNGSPADFSTRKRRTLSAKSAENFRSGHLYPNGSGQLSTNGFRRVFADLVDPMLLDWDNPIESCKAVCLKHYAELVMRHNRNAFQSNITLVLTRTMPRNMYRQLDSHLGPWHHILIRNDRARFEGIKKENIRPIIVEREASQWTTLGLTIGYETEACMMNLGVFKSQPNRDMHQFGFCIPTLLFLNGVAGTRQQDCPIVRDAWDRTTKPFLFD